jgi:hypothetical protein
MQVNAQFDGVNFANFSAKDTVVGLSETEVCNYSDNGDCERYEYPKWIVSISVDKYLNTPITTITDKNGANLQEVSVEDFDFAGIYGNHAFFTKSDDLSYVVFVYDLKLQKKIKTVTSEIYPRIVADSLVYYVKEGVLPKGAKVDLMKCAEINRAGFKIQYVRKALYSLLNAESSFTNEYDCVPTDL